jgi:glycosyltransferase involved in cell wall biosynthesis
MDQDLRPTVSIIMPAYQAGPWIGESIESICAQTYPEWELWIIDDGSTDNTREICTGYTDSDPRINYVFQVNGRQGKARNLGISKSKGKYLAFLDADDLWLPEKLEKTLEILRASECAMVCTGALEWDGSPNLYSGKEKHVEDRIYAGQDAVYYFGLGNRVPMSTVLIHKEALIAVGGFDENRSLASAEDYDLWLRLLKAGYAIRSVKNPLTLYRVHPGSSTHFDHVATLPAARVVLKNLQAGDLPREQWIRVRRRWIQRLAERWKAGENPKVVQELIAGFFPGDRLLPWILYARKFLSYTRFMQLLDRYSMSRP